MREGHLGHRAYGGIVDDVLRCSCSHLHRHYHIYHTHACPPAPRHATQSLHSSPSISRKVRLRCYATMMLSPKPNE